MEAKLAERYPLFKEYDFALHFAGSGGSGTLLIPRRDIYIAKNYGFGYLALAPHLQLPFNDGEAITVEELVRELREEGNSSLVPNRVIDSLSSGGVPFLHQVLNRFRKDEIVNLQKRAGAEESIDPKDILSTGENYSKVRVYNMERFRDEPERIVPFAPISPFPVE